MASATGVVMVLTSVACVDAPTQRPGNSNNLTAQSLMDPMRAAATANVATRRFDNLKGDLPVVSLAYTGADSAEVWRCRATYALVYGNGLQKLSDLPKSSPEYREAAKEAYKRMPDPSNCVNIATSTTAQSITDYAARRGTFYYVVNPCVTPSASTTSKAGCSFALEITQPIQYENNRTDNEVEVLSRLSVAEGRLYGNFNSMRRAAEEANESMTNCTLQEAANRAYKTQLFGLIKLVSAVAVAPLVNGVMAGAGTVLDSAISGILGMAAPKQLEQVDCPPARVKMEFYNELQAKTVEIVKEVLEARKSLNELDTQYVSVEKELAALKSGQK